MFVKIFIYLLRSIFFGVVFEFINQIIEVSLEGSVSYDFGSRRELNKWMWIILVI